MAIVQEYKFGNATIRIHDDVYAQLTPEENAAKEKAFKENVGKIFWECMERKAKKEGKNK